MGHARESGLDSGPGEPLEFLGRVILTLWKGNFGQGRECVVGSRSADKDTGPGSVVIWVRGRGPEICFRKERRIYLSGDIYNIPKDFT